MSSFKHNRKRWEIVTKDDLRSPDGNSCMGYVDYDSYTVYISNELPPKERLSTLLHEGLHVAFPYLKEDAVLQGEELLFKVLDKEGFRLGER